MKKFISVAAEVDGHARASGMFITNPKAEQQFRDEFLLYEGKPIAELSSRHTEGDTVYEYFKETVFCSGDFSMTTTTLNDVTDMENRMFDTCTG